MRLHKFLVMKKIFPLLILILNFGCFQSVEKSHINSMSSLQEISNQALSSTYFEEGKTKNEQWWKVFKSFELNVLMQKAIKNNPTLQAAEAKIVEAQASAKIVRSKLFPKLSASAVDNWNYLSKYGFDRDFFPLPDGNMEIPHKYNTIDLSVNFTYEIDFWGKNRKQLQEALGLAMAEQMEKNQAELILCTSVAYSYFEWQAHRQEKELYEKWLASELELDTFYASRYQTGIDDVVPSLKQYQASGDIQQKIVDLEKQMTIDLLFLKTLIAEDPASTLSLSPQEEILEQKIIIPETIGLDLVAQRPDLMAQIWRVSSAAKAIGVAKTEFYPNVNLNAFAGLSSLSFSHLFNWASRTGALTPAINLPLFTGGALRANLGKKIALYNEAVASYNSLLLQAAQEVVSSITTFLSLEKQIDIQTAKVSFQQEAFQAASLRYKKGVDNMKPMITSSQELLAQELSMITLRHALILSSLQIFQSLGGGMQPQALPSAITP
jgi:NodT family efflux transporter outer membrane factor (OMF) lipoprotein